MAGIYERNNALSLNPNDLSYPKFSDINITTHGSNWYWAVMAVMASSTIGFIGLSYTVDKKSRIFHYITAAITMVATIAYFTMASNLGYAAVPVEFQRSNPKVAGTVREIFYVRYIDWVITTPLLLTDLLLTAGLPWSTILYTVLVDEVMIITGLVGALVESQYKWGYFTFAMVSLIFICYNVVHVARKNANLIGGQVPTVFLVCGVWTMFLWFIYPIAWGLSEGANVIAPDSEAVFYGVLDILAKPVFGAMLLYGHKKINIDTLGLKAHQRYQVANGNELNDPEKNTANGNGRANGHGQVNENGQTHPSGAPAFDGQNDGQLHQLSNNPVPSPVISHHSFRSAEEQRAAGAGQHQTLPRQDNLSVPDPRGRDYGRRAPQDQPAVQQSSQHQMQGAA